MSNTAKWIVGVVVVALVVWGLVATNKNKNQDGSGNVTKSEETGPIKIGLIGPMTGDQAGIGQNEQAAVQIAVDEVNKAGGVKGRNLEVIYEDGKCSGAPASSAANKLINVDKVPVILGGVCSGETMAFAATANQGKTVVLSPCSSSPKVTDAGDYIFRNYPSDNFQGDYAAKYIYNTLAKKKAAVLYVNSDYGVGIQQVFSKSFEGLGGSVVMNEGFDPANKDSRTLLSKVKSSGADIIYYVGYTETSVPALKQAADLKLNIPFFGADGWDDPTIWEQAGASGEGQMYSVIASNTTGDFKTKMKEKTGSDQIIVCSPPAYDGIKILAKVMNKVGTNPEAIKNELYKTTYEGGVSTPTISFDQNGDLTTASYHVQKIVNGKSTEIK